MTRASAIAATVGALMLCGTFAGCADREPADTAPAESSSPVSLPNDGASIFALDIPLVDHTGRTLTLRDLGGRPMVASMVYASCTSICPRVTAEMQAIERDFPNRDDVRFVLFSLDPARDTPEAWSRFAADHRLDMTRWRLVTPTDDGVRDLAAVLGMQYAPEANGEIAHTALIAVIDRLGVVQHRQVGLGQDPANALTVLARTVR